MKSVLRSFQRRLISKPSMKKEIPRIESEIKEGRPLEREREIDRLSTFICREKEKDEKDDIEEVVREFDKVSLTDEQIQGIEHSQGRLQRGGGVATPPSCRDIVGKIALPSGKERKGGGKKRRKGKKKKKKRKRKERTRKERKEKQERETRKRGKRGKEGKERKERK